LEEHPGVLFQASIQTIKDKKMVPVNTHEPGSFRDPSGFVFFQDDSIYRQVDVSYRENYDHLIGSGLYHELVDSELLISHAEVDQNHDETVGTYRILRPELVPFISYPYEWCFSQLKDAALVTLEIQKRALKSSMTLKDASAYNVQFKQGRPVFIDTLSFERYREGQAWVAYRQFCQHFLAPLALMSQKDVRLGQLFRVHLDGIPLDLASFLLPFRSRFRFSLFAHIHLHAKSQKYFADKNPDFNDRKMSLVSLLGLVDNLESAVRQLKCKPAKSEWGDYYRNNNYSDEALQHKSRLISDFLERINPKSVWDLGANTGLFSRIAASQGISTISFDFDFTAVEKNYLECKGKGESRILPLVLDLTNPSPNIGWENRERLSLEERGPADAALALALVHHLAISNNLPLDRIAGFLGRICKRLIIEFIPKDDPQVQKLLSTRKDIFRDYHQQAFEFAFGKYFTLQSSIKIRGTTRTLYLMEKR
jgi:ribosomal protein L11 methylase PrmA